MKIKVSISQIEMNKSRKFVYFSDGSIQTDYITMKQAETVTSVLKQLDIKVDNQTGLTF